MDIKISRWREIRSQAMKATTNEKSAHAHSLEDAYLLDIKPCLTPEEVIYCKKLFQSSEEERSLGTLGYSDELSLALINDVSEKLCLRNDGSEPIEDLYAHFALEYRSWEKEVLSKESVRELDLYVVEDFFSNAIEAIEEGQQGTSQELFNAVKDIKAQFDEYIYEDDSGEHLAHLFSLKSFELMHRAANKSDTSSKEIVSRLLTKLSAIVKEKEDEKLKQQKPTIENKAEYNKLIYDYCDRLILAKGIGNKIDPDELLTKSQQTVLSKNSSPGENQNSAIKYAAFLSCQKLSSLIDIVAVRQENNLSRDTKVELRIKRIFGFLNQSLHIEDKQSDILKKMEVVYKTRRYYELFYQTPSILRTKKGSDEFEALIHESISNGFLSFVIDEIDRIVESESRYSSIRQSINDGWMSICIEHTPEKNTHKSENKASLIADKRIKKTGKVQKHKNRSLGERRGKKRRELAFPCLPKRGCSLIVGLFSVVTIVSIFPRHQWFDSPQFSNPIHLNRVDSQLKKPGENKSSAHSRKVSDRWRKPSFDAKYSDENSNLSEMAQQQHKVVVNAQSILSSVNEDRSQLVSNKPDAIKYPEDVVDFWNDEHLYTASWYGFELQNRMTASGELFNPEDLTIAHPTLPFNTKVEVRNPKTDRSIVARVTDRPPNRDDKNVVLSLGSANELGINTAGTSNVVLFPVIQ